MKRIYLTFVFAGAVCFQVAAQNVDEDRILSADSLITMDGRLDSLYRSLPEVMVVGERPVVKAMQGKLVYDLPRLIQNFAVDNAYDAIKELPGVSEMNDNLTLGGKSVTVVLDGKVTTMTQEQLNTLLKSIPAGRIEKGEVIIYGMHISPYEKGNIFNKDPLRPKKLLMHKSEIRKLVGKIAEQGYTLVPVEVYFKGSLVKVQIALAKGKKLYDKRQDIAKKDMRREAERDFKIRNLG